jgi:hypothetical protein
MDHEIPQSPSHLRQKQSRHYNKFAASATALLRAVRVAAGDLRARHRYTVQDFVARTNLHKNTILKLLNNPEWLPSLETLRLLDKIILCAEQERRRTEPSKPSTRRINPRVSESIQASSGTEDMPEARPCH